MPEMIINASGPQYGLVINPDGSLNIAGTVAVSSISGSIFIGSVSASVDSIYVQSGDNINITSLPNVVGVSGTYFQDIIGSIRSQNVQITNPWIILGSIAQTNIGSVIIKDIISPTGSIEIFQTTNTDLTANVTQVTSPWVVSGTSTIAGSAYITGSIYQVSNWMISGLASSVGISGAVNQGTNPWTISGNVLVSGLININNPSTIGSWTGYVGSIWSMPSINVSVGSEVYIKGGSLEGTSQIAGSIWSMPGVNVVVGSEVWIQNPVGISGINDIGSVVIKSAPVLGVSGLIFTDGNLIGSVIIKSSVKIGVSGIVEVSNLGSQSYLWGKSGANYYELASTPENALVTITSGTQTQWSGIGSVEINNPSRIGSYTGQYLGSETYIKAGSIQTYSPLGSTFILGSIYVTGSIYSANQYLGSNTWVKDTTPNNADRNNPYFTFIYMISGTATGVTGSRIGSVVQFIGAGSYVHRLIYGGDLLISVGSWS